MILFLIEKDNFTAWTQVKYVEVSEHHIAVKPDTDFVVMNYEDLRYAELILPNGGKVVLYRDETGGK